MAMFGNLLSFKNIYPADCIITVDDMEITELYPFVESVSVQTSRANNADAHITFASPADELDHWLVADDKRLLPDSKIKIIADFQTAREEIMRGLISTVTPSFPVNAGAARVEVLAQDDSSRFDRGPRIEVHGVPGVGTTDQFMLRKIIGSEASLDPFSGIGQSGLVLHQRLSDIQFMRQRARANNYELLFEAGRIYFGPWRTQYPTQPTIMAYAGKQTNCRSFSAPNVPQQSADWAYVQRNQYGDPTSETTVRSDEQLLGKFKTRNNAAGLKSHIGRLDRHASPDESENAARATGLANAGQFSIRADGELDGSLYGHVLKVALPVEVDGVGDQNSGIYYVDSVTHHFDSTGYAQKFSLLRNALGSAGFTSPTHALASVMGG